MEEQAQYMALELTQDGGAMRWAEADELCYKELGIERQLTSQRKDMHA